MHKGGRALTLGLLLLFLFASCQPGNPENGNDPGDDSNPQQGETYGIPAETAPPADEQYIDEGIFISPSGSDDNGSGTREAPYRTIQHVLDNVAVAGDTLILRGGIYNEAVRIRQPRITIRSKHDEWARIICPVEDRDNYDVVVAFDVDSSGGRLQRLAVAGGYYYGISFETRWDWGEADRGGASDILVENCIIHHTGRDCIKIKPGCDDIVIRNCEIFHSGFRDDGNAEGIDNVNGDRTLIVDCRIHDTATNGIYLKGGATACVVNRCLVENCGAGGILLGFDTSPEYFDTTVNPRYYENINGTVKNCVVRNTHYAGIGLFAARNARVLNNTIIDSAKSGQHSPIYFGITLQDWDTDINGRPASINPAIKNNIVWQSPELSAALVEIRTFYHDSLGRLDGLEGPVDMNANCYWGGSARFEDNRPGMEFSGNLAGWRSHMAAEILSFMADPGLANGFNLSHTSPCIDAGLPLSTVKTDYFRNLRIPPHDIGAVEYTP
ncbi:MAG TPA: right-handed parallel beta-helix repeat-containing protein [Candidatus Aminicenantes bacterium]|nr:right-handed parallel beta-helix repeat-containing protein [Candidatus Aminicenantes bacterium]